MATTQHSPRCRDNALGAIADNNYTTSVTEPGAELTSETMAEADEWLANGNVSCWSPDLCSTDGAF